MVLGVSSLVGRLRRSSLNCFSSRMMRLSDRSAARSSLSIASITTACVVPPEPGTSAPPEAQVLQADARALAYGRTASEIMQTGRRGPGGRFVQVDEDGQPYDRTITVKVKADVVAALDERAQRERTPEGRSGIIRRAIEEYLLNHRDDAAA